MKLVVGILVGAIALGVIGCSSTEVSDQDAKSFGKESEADRAAKASGEGQVDPGRN